jgi:hypothetical protein
LPIRLPAKLAALLPSCPIPQNFTSNIRLGALAFDCSLGDRGLCLGADSDGKFNHAPNNGAPLQSHNAPPGLGMKVDEWVYFVVSGEPQIVPVTTLPADLCRIIGASTPIVRLRHDYALKLQHKHGFQPDELPLLPIAIDLGRAISDQPRRLTFYFFERVISNRWYRATRSNAPATVMKCGLRHSTHKTRPKSRACVAAAPSLEMTN